MPVPSERPRCLGQRKRQEEKMRLITRSELASRSDGELAVLFDVAAKALAWTKLGSPERDRVVASLQNINCARACHHQQHRVPGL